MCPDDKDLDLEPIPSTEGAILSLDDLKLAEHAIHSAMGVPMEFLRPNESCSLRFLDPVSQHALRRAVEEEYVIVKAEWKLDVLEDLRDERQKNAG